MKKRIVVDLDVTTLAFWDKKDEAKLIERVKSGMFSMVTPYIILEHLSKWSYRKLAEQIASCQEPPVTDWWNVALAYISCDSQVVLEHARKFSLFGGILAFSHQLETGRKFPTFYEVYSSQIISAQNILDKTNEIGVDYKKLFAELLNVGVKEEDIVLVIIAGIFDVDCLVTFNRKHLKNNETKINEVLKKNGIKTIKITLPSEF